MGCTVKRGCLRLPEEHVALQDSINAFVERWSPTDVLPTIVASGMRSVAVNAPVDASRCLRSLTP